ncbi:MAG TPA: helicase-related protein [Xanthobacteraceae bacterium]|nr:helicase-related protein [Xanthobacteraceae bacterium]
MPVTSQFSSPPRRERGVTAVLGPTNTGKTHLAIERMLGHSSGLIGLPLRLLAREVYNRCVEKVGAASVALVTGEEKIKPPNPRFWVSTVEAMPRDLDVAFVAIDEAQIAGDFDRGHIFTDRMLHRRGREETLILGAATLRPLIEKLLPGADIVQRPRLSQLTFAGEKKITRLPRRSAIVAFSAEEVYAIAELIRRQRGGAAVVLGALSPRTRNAQVELYQSGDVDYLVATDAIGMGLNLDVDHIAFAADSKFDGHQHRRLNPAELAQIAGRAGRARRDGTFGTTGRCPSFEPELIERLESHNFEPLRVAQWRNSDLDFRSLAALIESLSIPPREEGLTRAPTAEDVRVLERAAKDDDVVRMATGASAIERLWEVCQVPDYRKVSLASHVELVLALYGFLAREGRIPTDWFSQQVALAERTEGDIDALSYRIAQVRTWTFVANRADWLDNPEHWQQFTRSVEDKLSDALHEQLALRFVDRRTSVLMRRLRENAMLESEVSKTGEVTVEGHVIGRLQGFEFALDATGAGQDAKALRAAAAKVLASEIEARAARLAAAPDEQFVLANDGVIRWIGEPIAKLIAGENALEPRFRVLADEQLTGAAKESVDARLTLWLKAHVEKLLGPLNALAKAEDVTGIARGIAFQLVESLGVLERAKVAEEVKGLDQETRATLRKYGVRFGAYHIYLPALLKPAPRTLALLLWTLKNGGLDQKGFDDLPGLAASGRTSIPVDQEVSKNLYRLVGYRVCGNRAIRVDILERLADLIRPALSWRPAMPGEKPAGAFDGRGFLVTVAMTSLAGCSGEDFASILKSLGYRLDRRPPLPETAKTDTAAPAVAADAAAPAVAAEASADEGAATEAPATNGADTPIELGLGGTDAQTDAPLTSEPAAETPPAEATEPAQATETPAAPALLDVWRPGRPEGARRPPHKPKPARREVRIPEVAAGAPPSAPAAGATASPARESKPREQREHRRPPRRKDGPRRVERPNEQYARAPRERDRPIDPNSPFAALLELKARLEAKPKE